MPKKITSKSSNKEGEVKIQKPDLSVVPEHDPRYNVSKTDLEKANERIRQLSVLKKSNAVIQGEKIIHKRTAAECNRIWNAFVNSGELDAFETAMQYTKKTIKRIGIRKFIDAMDWKDEKDVKKWRSDRLHIVPCCHCKCEFAVYEELALCSKCAKLYDLDQFANVVNAVEADPEGKNSAWMQRYLFTIDENIRNMYLKEKKIKKGKLKEYSVESEVGINNEKDRNDETKSTNE